VTTDHSTADRPPGPDRPPAPDDRINVDATGPAAARSGWERRLGAHLSLGAGLLRAAARAETLGIRALQLFTDNPTAWRRRTSPPRDLDAFRARIAGLGIDPVVVHAPYLLNLASPDEAVWTRSVEGLARELAVAPTFGARFIVLHLGSHLGSGSAAGIDRIARGVAAALELVGGRGEAAGERSHGAAAGPGSGARPDAVRILLENSAGSGDAVGSTVAELADVVRAIEAAGVPASRIGICLDTAHAWSAGIAIDRAAGVDDLLGEIERRIGLDRLGVVHLNDSRAEFGSRVDRHEHLGAGRIGTEGLGRILVHPALAHVAYILETPGMDDGWDAVNLARALAIATGLPLEPLPEAAFTGRGRDSGRSGPPEEASEVA
jgi:deoxyribonuclease-4